jgi:hypothetical protein
MPWRRIAGVVVRWRWVVSLTPRPLYPRGKNTLYPLDRRLGGPHSRSRSGSERKIPSPCRELNPNRSARSPVAMPTELFRLPNFVVKKSYLIPSKLVIWLSEHWSRNKTEMVAYKFSKCSTRMSIPRENMDKSEVSGYLEKVSIIIRLGRGRYFHENWYEHHSTRGHSTSVLFSFLSSTKSTRQLCDVWEQY